MAKKAKEKVSKTKDVINPPDIDNATEETTATLSDSNTVSVQFKSLKNETRVTYYGTFKIDNKGIAKDIDKRNLEVFDKLKIEYKIIKE